MADKKADIRRKHIIEKLLSEKSISYDYIMSNFHISERSMQQDIRELTKQGYDIKGVKAVKGYILKNDGLSDYYEPANTQNIRMLYVLRIIEGHRNGLSLDELYEIMYSKRDEVETVANKKTLKSTLNDMVSKRLLKKNKDRYVTSVNAPVQVSMSTTEAMDTLNLLETFSKGNPFEDTLMDVKKKLLIALFNDDEDDGEEFSDYVVYKKDYSTAGMLSTYLEELNSYPFENKGLLIKYRTKDGLQINTVFYIGNVVYSVDKDRLYIVGENDNGMQIIIHYKSIEHIETIDADNTVFQNEFYTSIVNDMFAISLDPAEEVEVIFDNVFRIKEKLLRLTANRPNGSLAEEDDRLIYRDKVSGLLDLAAYLRRFGSACEVIKPLELRMMMRNTAVRTLEAYKSLNESVGDLNE